MRPPIGEEPDANHERTTLMLDLLYLLLGLGLFGLMGLYARWATSA